MATGNWDNFYNCMVSYNLPSGTYVYGVTTPPLGLIPSQWFVSKVDENSGQLSTTVDTGSTTTNAYSTVTVLYLDGQPYLFQQRADHFWTINEIMPDGKIGPILSAESFDRTYFPLFLNTEGESFYLGTYNGYWFTRQLFDNGTISTSDINNSSYAEESFYSDSTPIQRNVNGVQYVLEQSASSHVVRVWSFSEGTQTMTLEYQTTWQNTYETMGFINVNGVEYLYGQSQETKKFFIEKFLKDSSNEVQAELIGKTAIGIVLVWKWQAIQNLRVGHVSVVLYTNSNDITDPDNTYISWWPGESAANKQLAAPPKDGATYASDVEDEGSGPNSFATLYSNTPDAAKKKITRWWTDFQRNQKRWSLSQNCATTVKDLLVNVGAYNAIDEEKLDYYYGPGFWVPINIYNLVNDINNGTGSLG